MIRRLRLIASRRKSIAAQRTTRKRLRLSKWIITGPSAQANPAMAKPAVVKVGRKFMAGCDQQQAVKVLAWVFPLNLDVCVEVSVAGT